MIKSNKYGTKVQVYKLKNGDISYGILYKKNGKSERKYIGRRSQGITERICLDRYNSLMMELRHGTDLSIKKDERYMEFHTLALKYFSDKEIHNKSNYKTKQHYLKHIRSDIGFKKIAELSDSNILSMQKKLMDLDYSNATNNKTIQIIKTIINYAIKIDLIKNNPFKNIIKLKENNSRDRILTVKEVEKLYLLITKEKITTQLFLYLALSTGARVEGILNIQMQNINFKTKTIQIWDFKRNKNYIGILSNDVHKILKKHYRNARNNVYLVSKRTKILSYSAIYSKITRILKPFNVGVNHNDRKNKLVLHSLRHTFASHLTMDGTNSSIVQKLMNHADPKMTARYTHLYESIGANRVDNLYKNNGF